MKRERSDQRFVRLVTQQAAIANAEHRKLQIADLVVACLDRALWPAELAQSAANASIQVKRELYPAASTAQPNEITFSLEHANRSLSQFLGTDSRATMPDFACGVLVWLSELAVDDAGCLDAGHRRAIQILVERKLHVEAILASGPSRLGQWIDDDFAAYVSEDAEAISGRQTDLKLFAGWLRSAVAARRSLLIIGEAGVGKSLFTEHLLASVASSQNKHAAEFGDKTRFALIRPLPSVFMQGEVDAELEKLSRLIMHDASIIPVFDQFDAMVSHDVFRLAFAHFFGGAFAAGGRAMVFIARPAPAVKDLLFRHVEQRTLPEITVPAAVTAVARAASRNTEVRPEGELPLFSREVVRFALQYFPALALPASALSLLDKVIENARLRGASAVSLEDLKTAVSTEAGVEKRLLTSDPEAFYNLVQDQLDSEILGQQHASQRICRRLAKWERQNRRLLDVRKDGFWRRPEPVRILLVGPSGIGKTETATYLAHLLGRPLHKFSMNQYSTEMGRTSFIGSDPGYEKSGQTDTLFALVQKDPRCVVLLDEIEKAHADVQNILLGVLEGEGKDETGKTVSFHQAIFLMTSNYAEALISAEYETYRREMSRQKVAAEFDTARVKAMLQAGVAAEIEHDMLRFLDDSKRSIAREFREWMRRLAEIQREDLGSNGGTETARKKMFELITDQIEHSRAEAELTRVKAAKSIGNALLDRAHEIIPYFPFVRRPDAADGELSGVDDSDLIEQLVGRFLPGMIPSRVGPDSEPARRDDDLRANSENERQIRVRAIARQVPNLASVRTIKTLVEQDV